MSPLNFGRDDLMAVAAFRYCLGRQTYIVGDCADWLIDQWPNISPSMRKIIERDLREEFKRDDEARKRGDTYRSLGADMDRGQWSRVLAMIEQEPKP